MTDREDALSPRRRAAEVAPDDLAGLGDRFGGALLDNVVLMPGALAFFLIDEETRFADRWMIAAAAYLLAVVVLQAVLIAASGQSIGKKAVKTRIVDAKDYSNPGFWRAVGLRWFLPGLIGNVPLIGGLFGLVDVAFVFTPTRQCVHDRMAGTKVVRADAVHVNPDVFA